MPEESKARKYRLKHGQVRLQVLVTHRCNAVCDHCDKAVGLARFPDIEMTAWRMKKAVHRARRNGLKFARVTLSGGEPVVNKELQDIIEETSRMPGMEYCRVLTNDLDSTKEKREAIEFPDERFAWIKAPLDDTSDPKSGKNKPRKRYRDRIHLPYWISPADLGLESTFERCTVKSICGRGLDNKGYSMCGQAPILGRLLGVNPYPEDNDHLKEHINKPVPEICKHCIYGMRKDDERGLRKAALKGNVPHISETYEKAFENADGPELVQLTM